MTEVYNVKNTADNVNAEPSLTKPCNSRIRNTQTTMTHADKSRYFFCMAGSEPLECVDMSISAGLKMD